MKKILALIFACSTPWSFANELNSFQDITKALNEGHKLKLVVNFAGCTPTPPVANLSAYTEVSAVMLQPNFLQFSNTPITTNNPNYPDRAVLENITYRISVDNKVKIATKIITLPEYHIANSHIIECQLNKKSVRVFD